MKRSNPGIINCFLPSLSDSLPKGNEKSSIVRAEIEPKEPSIVKLAPRFWAKPGKIGITVL